MALDESIKELKDAFYAQDDVKMSRTYKESIGGRR